MYATVDMILDKLEVQIKKHSEKSKEKRHGPLRAMDVPPSSDNERSIIGEDKFVPKPMFLDEAAMQLEQLGDEDFLVYLDAETNRVNVLYRRKDGNFGLIDAGQ
jgi:putative sigma-54 modulation protein